MIAAQPASVPYNRQGIVTMLTMSLSIVMLLAISLDSTIIPTAILRQYAWRFTLVLPVVLGGLIWLNHPMKVSGRIWNRVLIFAAILGGFYVALVLAESVNTMSSGSAPLIVRSTFFRILTIVPAMLTIFIASGGGIDVVRGLRSLLRPYVILCLVIAIGGILAWALVQYDIVPWEDWLVPQELSAKLDRKGGANLYSLPYYLGLVLVGASDIDIIGTFRISGWSAEPHTAALFVTPALFAIPLVFKGKRWISILACSLIIVFDFLAFSVTNLLALGAIGGFVLLRWVIVGKRLHNLHISMAFISLVGLAALIFGGSILQSGRVEFIRYKSFDSISADAVEGVHQTIANTNSVLGKGIFSDNDNDLGEEKEVGLISSVTFWAQAAILAAAGCLLFMSRKPTYPLGLSILYVVLHSMKDPSHILWWPVYLFVIVITILALSAPGENKSTTSTDSSVEERELPEVSH
jgi:hypothetical protein